MFLKPLTKDEYGLILGTAERDLGMDRDGFSVYMCLNCGRRLLMVLVVLVGLLCAGLILLS